MVSGCAKVKPNLPSVGGNEGVGTVVEVGEYVSSVRTGQRVLIANKQLGSWRYYGIFHEINLQVISDKLPVAEASMISIAPCTALRLMQDFRRLYPMDTVAQNAANSPVGQSVIQICKAWGINTYNIISQEDPCVACQIKQQLMDIGATDVFTIKEALENLNYTTALSRPVLALNALGGLYEEVLVKMLRSNGTIVYYGAAFDSPANMVTCREDVHSRKFDMSTWYRHAPCLQKKVMVSDITTLIALGHFKGPFYELIEIRDYVQALRGTEDREAYATKNYVFDLTLPF